MKKVYVKMIGALLLLSNCNKQGLPIKEKIDPDDFTLLRSPGLLLPRFETICISSYKELQQTVGSEILIKSVVLENGQTMEVGKDAVQMRYFAVDAQEGNSIFRSKFEVKYNEGGYLVSPKQEVWTLGCFMTNRGTPPFTNIVFKEKLYIINTSFVWSVPPLAVRGYKILWLVA